jgi:phosphatidylglycerophosphatase C
VRVAVFDLDGTITRHDTFLPFLRGWLARHPRPGFGPRALLALASCCLRGIDRGRLKSDLVRAGMRGAREDEVRAWSAEFAGSLGEQDLCPGALAAIECHRAAGDRLVLLSASVDLYVPEIARRFGFDETHCTGIAWRDGRLDGSLTTLNRRAEEKRRCIEDLRRRFPGARIRAYGNSPADFPHLKAVDEPRLVNGAPGVRRAALKLGIPIENWRNKSA